MTDHDQTTTRDTGNGVEGLLTRHGGLTYLEIPATDLGQSAAFYEHVLDWQVEWRRPDDPRFRDPTGHLIGRWVTDRPITPESGLLPYVYVDRIDEAIARVAIHGGMVDRAPSAEGNLWIATVRDPAGNAIGLWQAGPRRAGTGDGDAGGKRYAFAWKRGEGWTYQMGIDFAIKAGEINTTNGAAVLEYTTRKGEEPDDHTHPTEDEMFYVLAGEMTFRCADQSFDVDDGGFVFLPRGVEHGYTIRSDGPVRLLVVTSPPRKSGDPWGGFVGDLQSSGEVVSQPSE
ncbi:MAG TPA: cupin domain-containing protein [Chloroflexota bacterium]|nr:cupin domain-containing protein [Chloroflexota bacterium]